MKRLLNQFLSPSMAVATLALVVALGGTGYAAVHFADAPDTSTQRATSSPPAQPVLKSGQKMVGYFASAAGNSDSGYSADAVTFPAKLPDKFKRTHVQYIAEGADYTVQCPGPGQAKAGWACLYEGQSSGANLCCIYAGSYDKVLRIAPYGFRIYWYVGGSAPYADGQWVVRAP